MSSVVCGSLIPRLPTPRFYLAAVEKNPIFLHSCEIKSGRGKPGYEASVWQAAADYTLVYCWYGINFGTHDSVLVCWYIV